MYTFRPFKHYPIQTPESGEAVTLIPSHLPKDDAFCHQKVGA